MRKTQIFNMRLVPEAMAKLDKHLTGPGGIFSRPCSRFLKVTFPGNITWRFDEFDHFFAEYPHALIATYRRVNGDHDIFVENSSGDNGPETYVTVSAPDRATIDSIFAIIQEYRAQSTNLDMPSKGCRKPRNRVN